MMKQSSNMDENKKPFYTIHLYVNEFPTVTESEMLEDIKWTRLALRCITNPTEEMKQLHNMLWKI